MTDKPKTPKLKQLAEQISKKAKQRANMLDSRFQDITEWERSETDDEQYDRIMNDPTAWKKL